MRNQNCQKRSKNHIDVQRKAFPEPNTVPFSGQAAPAVKGSGTNILQLNVEGLSTSKINVIEQLAYKNKALVILLQETHCPSRDKLVIPNYILAGHNPSRKHGLATFVHERLTWKLVNQSPQDSEIEWLCIEVEDHYIVNVYKPPPSQLQPSSSLCSPTPAFMLATLTVSIPIGGTTNLPTMETAWLTGRLTTPLPFYTIQRSQLVSSLDVGTQAPTRTLLLQLPYRALSRLTDVY